MESKINVTNGHDESRTALAKVEDKRTTVLPRIDLRESPDKLTLEVELPGVAREGLDLTVEDRVLKLTGKVERIVPEGFDKPVFSERVDADFERRFKLAETIDSEQIKARFEAGLLTLELPKAGPAKPHKIAIN